MGYPVPGWDAVGQIGNLRRVDNPPTTGAQLTKLSGKRPVGRRSRPAIVYYLNMYVRRSRARAVIQETEHLELSERDSLRVLAVLENPPKPNAKLLAAAKSLPKRK